MINNDLMIYELVRAAGIVRTKNEFSKLCGRTSGWFSCLLSRQEEACVAPLGILAAHIEHIAHGCDAGERRQVLAALHRVVQDEIHERCVRQAGLSARPLHS